MSLSPKIKKAAKPFIYISIVVLVLLLLAAITIVALFPSEKAKAMIVAELSKRLGHTVSIEAVSVGFYPDAEIVAGNVRVADSETTDKLASIRKARFDLNMWQLLKGKYIIEAITIDSPSLLITRHADGSWTMPGLIPASTPKQADSGKQNGNLEIGDIHIRDGSLRFRDEASGIEASARSLNGTIDPRGDKIYLHSALVAIPGVDMEISGTVSRFSKPDRTFQANASGHLKKSGPLEKIEIMEAQKEGILADMSVDASGSTEVISLNFKFSATPQVLPDTPIQAHLTGTLRTRQGMLAIDSLEVSSPQSSVKLAGSGADLWSETRSARLEGTADIAVGEFAPTLEAEGIAAATIEAAASMYRIDMNTDIDLTGTAFTVPNLMHKKSGIKSSLAARAYFLIPGEIIIDDFIFAVEDAKINGSGRLNPASEPRAQFSISASGFPLEMLDRMPSVGFESGSLDLSVDLQKTERTNKGIEYRGNAAVRDALLQVEHLSAAVQVYDLSAEFETDQANLTCDSALFAGSACSFDAKILGFSKPAIVGMLHADTLDLEKITAAFSERHDDSGTDKNASSPQADAQPSFSAEIAIEADSLKTGKLSTGAIKGTLIGTDGSYVFENFEADVFEGSASGSIRLDPSPQGLRWAADFEGQGMGLKAIAMTFREEKSKYQGTLSTSGHLGGIAASQLEDTLGSMKGTLQLTVTNGEIRDYLFLKNIIMLMQFSPTTLLLPGVREVALLNTAVDAVKTGGRSLDPTRLKFSKIAGSFQIQDGIAHTEDLRLECGLANLLFKGDVDLGKSQLDMRVRATPLGAVGSLMGKVPIAGKTLEKGKETVLSMDFLARGPISDPEVKVAVIDKVTPNKEKKQE